MDKKIMGVSVYFWDLGGLTSMEGWEKNHMVKVSTKEGYEKKLKKLHRRIGNELVCMTNALNGYIPGLVMKGQCITQALVDISNNIGNECHEKFDCFGEGMVLGFVCKNDQTRCLHFDPFVSDGNNKMGDFMFEFSWASGKYVRVKLIPGTVIYYTGYGIMHRQMSLKDKEYSLHPKSQDDFKFWNISGYGNKTLYEKVMSTFSRITTTK